jgi:hypothetical protein
MMFFDDGAIMLIFRHKFGPCGGWQNAALVSVESITVFTLQA